MRNILIETYLTNGCLKTNIIIHVSPAIKAFGSYPKGDKGDTTLIKDHTDIKALVVLINKALTRPVTLKGNLFGRPVSDISHIELTLL